MKEFEQIKDAIQRKINKEPFFIAIDGRCTSGKSTLGEYLAKELDACFFHMDDFYLRMEQRTEERYAEPGGNVDRERFKEEVLKVLLEKKDVYFRPFSHAVMGLGEEKVERYKPIVVVEGSYSLHPVLEHYYDYKIMLDVTYEKQIERLKQRNPEKLQMFIDKWIPLEELYFQSKDQNEIYDDFLNTTQLW